MMLATPSSNSMVMTGMVAPSKFEKIDMRAVAPAWALADAEDFNKEASACVVAMAVVEAALVVVEDSVVAVVASLEAGMEVEVAA
jgi:hypothetical protein